MEHYDLHTQTVKQSFLDQAYFLKNKVLLNLNFKPSSIYSGLDLGNCDLGLEY